MRFNFCLRDFHSRIFSHQESSSQVIREIPEKAAEISSLLKNEKRSKSEIGAVSARLFHTCEF